MPDMRWLSDLEKRLKKALSPRSSKSPEPTAPQQTEAEPSEPEVETFDDVTDAPSVPPSRSSSRSQRNRKRTERGEEYEKKRKSNKATAAKAKRTRERRASQRQASQNTQPQPNASAPLVLEPVIRDNLRFLVSRSLRTNCDDMPDPELVAQWDFIRENGRTQLERMCAETNNEYDALSQARFPDHVQGGPSQGVATPHPSNHPNDYNPATATQSEEDGTPEPLAAIVSDVDMEPQRTGGHPSAPPSGKPRPPLPAVLLHSYKRHWNSDGETLPDSDSDDDAIKPPPIKRARPAKRVTALPPSDAPTDQDTDMDWESEAEPPQRDPLQLRPPKKTRRAAHPPSPPARYSSPEPLPNAKELFGWNQASGRAANQTYTGARSHVRGASARAAPPAPSQRAGDTQGPASGRGNGTWRSNWRDNVHANTPSQSRRVSSPAVFSSPARPRPRASVKDRDAPSGRDQLAAAEARRDQALNDLNRLVKIPDYACDSTLKDKVWDARGRLEEMAEVTAGQAKSQPTAHRRKTKNGHGSRRKVPNAAPVDEVLEGEGGNGWEDVDDDDGPQRIQRQGRAGRAPPAVAGEGGRTKQAGRGGGGRHNEGDGSRDKRIRRGQGVGDREGGEGSEDDEGNDGSDDSDGEGGGAADHQRKPRTRDVTGRARQVIIIAKILLFVYALCFGPFLDRQTYLMWCPLVYEVAWYCTFPKLVYRQPRDFVYRIMVNNLATLKCNCKLAIRNACREYFKLYKPALTRGQIGHNRDIMQDVYPLRFHCDHPRNRTGHYQAEILAMAIAMALFYGENAPGVLFHEFFNPIPIPTLAFILTMIEFCLSEWTTGLHVPRDLKSVGRDGLLNMYLSHMENLRLYRTVDDGNLAELREDWFNYGIAFSNASIHEDDEDLDNLFDVEEFRESAEYRKQRASPRPRYPRRPAQSTANTRRDRQHTVPADRSDQAESSTRRQRPLEHPLDEDVAWALQNAENDLPSDLENLDLDIERQSARDASFGYPSPIEATPERDGNGRYTAHSKGKGRMD